MSIDDQISAFTGQLNRWCFEHALEILQPSDDITAAKKIVAGLKLLKQFDELKSQGLVSLATLLNAADVSPPGERIKTLLHGFERAARLEGIGNEILDWDCVRKINDILDDIVVALAAMAPNRALLVPLLDHENTRVRVLVARYLIDLMPDRVIPMLQKIHEDGDGSSDSFTAFLVVETWEIERRGRFNALEDMIPRG